MPDLAPGERTMRADALHNRERILEAARTLLSEHGADVPLDQIAERAGVSIATLYRRFSDRSDLLGALVVDASETVLDHLEEMVAEVESGCDRATWERSMHDLVLSASSHLAPVMVAMGSGLVPLDDDMALRFRARAMSLMDRLVGSAQEQGLIRTDTTPSEVQAILMRACQPHPHLTVEQNRELASRTLYVVLAGLHPIATGRDPIPGEPFRIPEIPV